MNYISKLFKLIALLSRSKWGIALLVVLGVFATWLTVEMIFFSGERIHDAPYMLGNLVSFQVDKPGVRYAFTVGRRNRPGKKKLEYIVTDPAGYTVLEGSDVLARKTRRFCFTPQAAGTHTFIAQYPHPNLGHDWVAIDKGDRTFLMSRLGIHIAF